jgi:hypothetical protein
MKNMRRRVAVLCGAAISASAVLPAHGTINGFSGFAGVNTEGAAAGDANVGYTNGGSSFVVTDGQNRRG